jgi:rod shape-determining protein MreB
MSKKDEMDQDEVFFVGIDLGTSRSAVSTSRGTRKWVESYVGWPKDFVARKLLGQRVLFGEEALNHRLSLLLCRPWSTG